MGIVANRAVTIQGKTHQPGDAVDAASLGSDKVQQLVAQRALRDTNFSAPSRCVALRTTQLGGKSYKRGDLVDVGKLRSDKVSQLLEHRVLDLAPVAAAKR
jgi:hypothetical protein